jgi:hypothetical protein
MREVSVRTYWALAAFAKRHSGFIWGFTIAWLISHWRDLVILWGEVSNWYPIVVLFIICEVMFNVGILVMAAATGSQVFSGTGLRPRRWLKALGVARREFGKTFDNVQNRKAFRWGLYLNWFGAAMGTGFLPLILIPLLLPVTSWPLMITPMVDLLLTFASRMTIQQRTNRNEIARPSQKQAGVSCEATNHSSGTTVRS